MFFRPSHRVDVAAASRGVRNNGLEILGPAGERVQRKRYRLIGGHTISECLDRFLGGCIAIERRFHHIELRPECLFVNRKHQEKPRHEARPVENAARRFMKSVGNRVRVQQSAERRNRMAVGDDGRCLRDVPSSTVSWWNMHATSKVEVAAPLADVANGD